MPTDISGTTGVTFPDGTIQARGGARQLAQVQTFQTGAVATGTTLIPTDDTIPQNTEGDQYMSLAITPTNVNSTLEIDVVFVCALSSGANRGLALFQDATADALAAVAITAVGANTPSTTTFKHVMTAGTTASTTFKVRAGPAAAVTMTFNGNAGGRIYGGVMSSRITIKEYLP
jgi:hypothetical protein